MTAFWKEVDLLVLATKAVASCYVRTCLTDLQHAESPSLRFRARETSCVLGVPIQEGRGGAVVYQEA